MILNGTLEEIVEVFIAVPCHTSRDACVITKTFGGTGEALATVGVVLETCLGLEGAFVDEAGLVDEGGVKALPTVLGRELVFGVGGLGVGREQDGCGDGGRGDDCGDELGYFLVVGFGEERFALVLAIPG